MSPAGARVTLDAFPPVLREALRFVLALARPGQEVWVVGGALRDALRGERPGDLDLAVSGGALALGRALADRMGGGYVELDRDRGVCRVVAEAQIDLADYRAPGLDGDLRDRDFTVNALAARARELVERGSAAVEDPTGGLADLEQRIVRLCGPRALVDDPVRALRVARLALMPGWRIDPATEAAVRASAPRAASVSAERTRDELIALVREPRAAAGLRLLDRVGVLPVLLPESLPMRETAQPEPHRFDVWEHSLRAVEAADAILVELDGLAPWGAELRAHLAEGLGGGITRQETLKLAALLHDVAKPETRAVEAGRIRFLGHDVAGARRAEAVGARWKLPGAATAVLAKLVVQHLRPMHLAQSGGVTRRARYRFYRDLADESRDLVLLALADAAALRGDRPLELWRGPGGAILRDLLAGLGEERAAAAAPPLLRGEDVMAAFGLAPGPEVGRLLDRAREAQALGLVSTREEALAFLRRPPADSLDTPEGRP